MMNALSIYTKVNIQYYIEYMYCTCGNYLEVLNDVLNVLIFTGDENYDTQLKNVSSVFGEMEELSRTGIVVDGITYKIQW